MCWAFINVLLSVSVRGGNGSDKLQCCLFPLCSIVCLLLLCGHHMTQFATISHVAEAAEQAKDVTGTSVSEAGGEVSLQAVPASTISSSAISGAEQTTLVHNEEEAFALEPLDVTAMAGADYVLFSLVSLIFCR